MPKLIKKEQVIDDEWIVIDNLSAEEAIPEGKVLLPLHVWEQRQGELAGRDTLGVWLNSDEEPSRLQSALDRLAVIAINFPAFTDGRGYSYARLLRERYHYQGEVRAIGDVLRDQLFFMKRCGFDSFALRPDLDPQASLSAFNELSDTYQAAADQPIPLFRRRGVSH
jgi:uncharacterized protein (DUF934 family)